MHFFLAAAEKESRSNYQLCRSEKAEANHLSERPSKQDEATNKRGFWQDIY